MIKGLIEVVLSEITPLKFSFEDKGNWKKELSNLNKNCENIEKGRILNKRL